MLSGLRRVGVLGGGVTVLLSFVIIAGVARSVLLWFDPPHPIRLHVRWHPDVDASRRGELERQLELSQGELKEGTTWLYTLQTPSKEAIRAIVQHPSVDDTAHVNRVKFRPGLKEDPERRALYYGAGVGGAGSLVTLLWLAARRRS